MYCDLPLQVVTANVCYKRSKFQLNAGRDRFEMTVFFVCSKNYIAQWSELFDTDFICHTKQMVQVNKLQHVQTCRLLQSLRRTERRVWSSNHCCGHAQRFEGWHAQTTTWKTQRNSMSVRLSQLQATMRS